MNKKIVQPPPQIENQIIFIECIYSDQLNFQRTTIDDPYISMKLNFAKPVNFLIHGWYGIIPEPEGTIPFRETGM